MNTQQAYINGFVKRASEYGLNQHQAVELLKQAESIKDELIRGVAKGVTRKVVGSGLGSLMGKANENMPLATPEQIAKLRLDMGVPASVRENFSSESVGPFSAKNNASYTWLLDEVSANSKNMQTLPVLSHEFGHSTIHHDGGLLGTIQDRIYPHGNAFGTIATTYLDRKMDKETNPLKGALIGGAVGLGSNLPQILPELEATRRGLKAINAGQPLNQKLKNIGAVLPGQASYFLAPAAQGAVGGAMKAKQNQKNNVTPTNPAPTPPPQ